MTPTARAMQDARELGFVAEKVEQKIPKTFITRDFAGFADLILFRPGVGIIAVQVTSGSNHAARRTKIAAEPRAATWLESGGRVEIWSYAKQGARGQQKRWTLRREEITSPPPVA